jgi:hypothetical protein
MYFFLNFFFALIVISEKSPRVSHNRFGQLQIANGGCNAKNRIVTCTEVSFEPPFPGGRFSQFFLIFKRVVYFLNIK